MMNKFGQTAQPVQLPTPPSYAEKSFLHTIGAGVVVPALQSLIISLGVGFLVFVLQMRFNAMLINAFWNSLTVIAFVFVPVLIYLLRHWIALTIERTFNIDIPGVGEDRTPKVTRIQIDEVTKAGHLRQAKIINLPATEEELKTLAAGLMSGRPFSEREWAGDGKLFSVSRFRALRQEMIRRGLLKTASDKDKRQGYVLTPEGEELMKYYARLLYPSDDEDVEK